MSSFFGAWICGKRRRSAAMISAVSSTESVVWVMYASLRVGRELERLAPRPTPDEDRRLRRLAHRPDDLLVAGVADQDDRVAVGRVAARLHVHLRHERAGGVDRVVAERAAEFACTDGRDAVRGEDDRRAGGHLLLARRRRSRRAPRARGRRGCCGRSACGRRRARRSARAPARPSRRRARRRRSSRAASEEDPLDHAPHRSRVRSATCVPERERPRRSGGRAAALPSAPRGPLEA